ncbi:cytochrome P450 [Hypomontagnella monticulosa]|nr:cytochrome P450 [Hypomontagnella monticulosa]
MSSVLLFQSHVDDVLASFTRKLNTEFVNKGEVMGEVIDFSQWATFLVADMIGKVTCGQPLGYIDRGCDFDGVLEANDKLMLYFSVVGMNPVLDKFLDKNTVYPIGVSSFRNFTRVALQLIERYKGEDKRDPLRPDFMDRFIESKVACPDVIDDVQILSYIAGQYVAGVDSTAAALRSIFYLSLKNPSVWGRLQAEILAAPFAQEDSMNLPAPFAEARAIPYLEAVIREAVRLYPGSCFPIERYVPAGGLTLPDGSFVPEGVAVGFNAYIVNRNKEIFGLDADVFRPERWLRDDENGEAEEDYKLRLTKMNNYDLSFSAGSRKCIGMNLGLMLLYKTAATLVALYEFELADPGKEWEIRSFVFPKQSGINVRMRQRGEMTIRKELGMPKPTGY